MRWPQFPLVGRDDELARFEAARRDASDDGPCFVLLFGEAGTGKTRLVEELGARFPGMHVVVGRAVDYAAAPYAPFGDVWRQLDLHEPVVLAKRPALRRTLAHLAAGAAPRGATNASATKLAAFDAAAEALRFFAARRPFALVLEDAHWSDLASLELVHHLALVGRDAPVLIVITARESELDEPRERLLRRLGRLPRVRQIRVRTLEPAFAAAIVDEELRRCGRSLEHALRRSVVEAADGNPLYLRELSRHLAEHAAGAALPGSLTASVRARLRALPDGVQDIVRAASILAEFDEELLANVAGISVAEAAGALRLALDRGLIVPPADAWRSLMFRHELIRRAVYEETLPAERRRLHEAMAAYLDAQPDLDPDFSRRALHAYSAGDRAAAARWNELAGDAASARFAFADAAEFYQRAVRTGAAAVVDKEAEALERAGRPVAALPLLRRRLGELGPAVDAAVRAALLLRVARAEVRAARRDAALEAIERARAALADAPAAPVQYAVHVFRAWLAATAMDAPGALRALADAQPYRELGDGQSIMHAYEAAAIAHGFNRDPARWRASYEGMVATAEESRDVVRTVGAIANFANSAFGLGETALALALEERAFALAEQNRCVELVPYVFATAAWTSLAVGDLARARRLVDRALPYCGDFPSSELIAASVGVVVAVRTMDAALLERCFREKLFDDGLRSGAPWQLVTVVPALTERWVALGRPDRARTVVARAAANLSSVKAMPEIALQIAQFGLERELPALERWLEEEVEERPNTAGFLHVYRSLVARAGSERMAHAQRAADAFRQQGYRLWEAAALERAGDTQAALALYEACGATRDRARLSTEKPPEPAGTSRYRLTKRENQIAQLAAKGLSNREIGDQLSVSDRTVEHHLGAVFAKLGVRSRVELAARRAP